MSFSRTAQFAGRGRRDCLTVLLILSLLCWSSCRLRGEPRHYLGPEIEADYIAHATQINYPDIGTTPAAELEFAAEPRRLRKETKDVIWDLGLDEAIRTALENSTVIRSAGQFLSPGNPILANPDFAPSVWDSALQESGVLFGQRGVEAALSDFDTQYTTQMLWGRNETVQNNQISSGLPAGSTLVDETANFNASLRKRLATGGQVELSKTWNYTGRNIPNTFGTILFPSVYEGDLQFQFRQPLLAGAGAEYTRIAGPVSSNIQGVTGVQQGVIIARINNDIELAEFERSVQQLVHDVEALYWQLHSAYRVYDSIVETRNELTEAWRKVDAQRLARTGGGAAQEADLRDSLLNLQGRSDLARDAIYSTEAQLRLLLGLPINDERGVIRPIDDPITAEIVPEWTMVLSDALISRPEIRRQKWNIKSVELQLKAAENLLMPRLDFVSSYQINAFGDRLLGGDARFASATAEQFRGDHTGWNLGFEFSVPIGRRFSKAQVRSLEFELAKSQQMLSEQEKEISHEVASVVRDIDRTYLGMQNAYNRLLTAKQRLSAIRSQYDAGTEQASIDGVARAVEAVSQAQLTLINTIQQYNIALADLNFRTGKTLEQNNITLSEGGWCPAAYYDALERTEEREHAKHRRWERLIHDAPNLYGGY